MITDEMIAEANRLAYAHRSQPKKRPSPMALDEIEARFARMGEVWAAIMRGNVARTRPRRRFEPPISFSWLESLR